MNTTTTQTLAEVKANQSITWTWLADMIIERGEDALVEVTRKHTAFGTFIIDIKAVAA
jgi:hypothetical protein